MLLRLTSDEEPSTPDGVLSECVIREPDADACDCDGAMVVLIENCFWVIIMGVLMILPLLWGLLVC